MSAFSVLDSYFEQTLIEDFPCTLFFDRQFCSCKIQIKQIFYAGFKSGSAHKKILQSQRKAVWLQTEKHVDKYEFMWLLLGIQVMDPDGKEGSGNTLKPVFPPMLPNSTPLLKY